MTGEGNGKHTPTSGAIWDRVDQQGRSISELTAAQAATQANLDALARTMQAGFDQINDSMRQVATDLRSQQERSLKPTNWYAIISGFVLVGGALLAFNTLQTDPMRANADTAAAQIEQIMERELQYAEFRGYTRATAFLVGERLDDLEEWKENAMRDLGRLDEISGRVADIDNRGSRRWNGNGNPGGDAAAAAP